MFLLAIMGVTLFGLAASQQNCAKAGGRSRMAKAAALKRIPPNLRKKIRKWPQKAAVGGSVAMLPRRTPVRCEPLPWLPGEVDAAFEAGLEAGLAGEDTLTGFVLHEVYHVTHDGEPIPWPALPQDSASLRALQHRARIRVRRHLAVLDDMRADQVYEGE